MSDTPKATTTMSEAKCEVSEEQRKRALAVANRQRCYSSEEERDGAALLIAQALAQEAQRANERAEAVQKELDSRDLTMTMLLKTLGGTVEGKPVKESNFLQRIRQLMEDHDSFQSLAKTTNKQRLDEHERAEGLAKRCAQLEADERAAIMERDIARGRSVEIAARFNEETVWADALKEDARRANTRAEGLAKELEALRAEYRACPTCHGQVTALQEDRNREHRLYTATVRERDSAWSERDAATARVAELEQQLADREAQGARAEAELAKLREQVGAVGGAPLGDRELLLKALFRGRVLISWAIVGGAFGLQFGRDVIHVLTDAKGLPILTPELRDALTKAVQ